MYFIMSDLVNLIDWNIVTLNGRSVIVYKLYDPIAFAEFLLIYLLIYM